MTSLDHFFFSAYPYLAIGIFLVGAIYRYREKGYQVTSLSAQFLEGKRGFWGTVPLHWGILMVFLGHLRSGFHVRGCDRCRPGGVDHQAPD